VTQREGYTAVTVSAESQQASGIATAVLKPARSESAAEVYGIVLSLQPLYDLRGRYLAAAAELRGLRATAANSEAEYQRLVKLYEDDRNVAERMVLAADAQWKSERAKLQAAEQSLVSLQDAIRASWGPVIAQWIADGHSAQFDALASQRTALVQIALPPDLKVSAVRAPLSVAPVWARSAARPARFISASPQTDPTLPGATYFYAVDGQGLRAGMRVTGQLKLGGNARDGVVLPEAAVIWHGGRAWAYEKQDATTFVRRPVSTGQELDGGWFNADGIAPGNEVVVSGAQLLLSEELKFQIRNENED
jgi:hypothetical protein